jgi:hypothetical protein
MINQEAATKFHGERVNLSYVGPSNPFAQTRCNWLTFDSVICLSSEYPWPVVLHPNVSQLSPQAATPAGRYSLLAVSAGKCVPLTRVVAIGAAEDTPTNKKAARHASDKSSPTLNRRLRTTTPSLAL